MEIIQEEKIIQANKKSKGNLVPPNELYFLQKQDSSSEHQIQSESQYIYKLAFQTCEDLDDRKKSEQLNSFGSVYYEIKQKQIFRKYSGQHTKRQNTQEKLQLNFKRKIRCENTSKSSLLIPPCQQQSKESEDNCKFQFGEKKKNSTGSLELVQRKISKSGYLDPKPLNISQKYSQNKLNKSEDKSNSFHRRELRNVELQSQAYKLKMRTQSAQEIKREKEIQKAIKMRKVSVNLVIVLFLTILGVILLKLMDLQGSK